MLPVRDLMAQGRRMCFAGTTLPTVTAYTMSWPSEYVMVFNFNGLSFLSRPKSAHRNATDSLVESDSHNPIHLELEAMVCSSCNGCPRRYDLQLSECFLPLFSLMIENRLCPSSPCVLSRVLQQRDCQDAPILDPLVIE